MYVLANRLPGLDLTVPETILSELKMFSALKSVRTCSLPKVPVVSAVIKSLSNINSTWGNSIGIENFTVLAAKLFIILFPSRLFRLMLISTFARPLKS